MNDLEILELKLRVALTRTIITEDGHVVEIRKLVDRIDHVKIEIYPNEHPPPHYHVRTNEFNVSISILDCEVLEGNPNAKLLKKIKYFHHKNKTKLIKVWNSLRPSDCPVGPISI